MDSEELWYEHLDQYMYQLLYADQNGLNVGVDAELLDMEWEELIIERKRLDDLELSKSPKWWSISLGIIEATEGEYNEARKVFRGFMKFKGLESESMEGKFKRFEELKMSGQYE